MSTESRTHFDDVPHPADSQAPRHSLVEYQSHAAVTQTNEAGAAHLAARSAKEVEARAIMARSRPRDVDLFRRRVLDSCRRPLFAAGREEGKGAVYRRKVGGNKYATGLSIRAAEECARLYGNLDIRAILISEDDERRTFESCACDLETNTWYTAPVVVPKTVWRLDTKGQRPISSKMNASGKMTYLVPADDDSLLVLQANMLAKAQREVVLKLIPSDIKEEMYDAVVATIAGEVKRDPAAARKKLLDAFYLRGVMPAQIAELLGHPTEVMTEAEIVMLKGYGVAMAEEGLTWAEVAQAHSGGGDSPGGASVGATKGTDGLRSALAKKGKKGAPSEASEAEPASSTAQTAASAASGGDEDDDIRAQDRELFERESR